MATKPNILVVDDDKNVLLSTVCFLEDEGFEVASAKSAEEALDMLDTHDLDIALVDMRLPGMDGNDFIREAAKKKSGMKFIVLTGSALYIIPSDLADLGITEDVVLKKPLMEMGKISDAIEALSSDSS